MYLLRVLVWGQTVIICLGSPHKLESCQNPTGAKNEDCLLACLLAGLIKEYSSYLESIQEGQDTRQIENNEFCSINIFFPHLYIYIRSVSLI